jgi:hypothetical protein
LVEDAVAGVVLAEIVRRVNPTFLKTMGIFATGDTKTKHNVMVALSESGLPVAAVRDADKEGQAKENMFKLPGTLPPEKEIFANPNVQAHVLEIYGIDLPKFLAISPDLDHHEWFGRLSEALAVNEGALVHETAKVYARSLAETEVDSLVEQLKEAVQK